MRSPGGLRAMCVAALVLAGILTVQTHAQAKSGRVLTQSNPADNAPPSIDCTMSGENFTANPAGGTPCEGVDFAARNVPEASCSFTNQFAYWVSLKNLEENHICGGVLIGKHWVLTAASCVDNALNPEAVFAPLAGIGGFELAKPVETIKTTETKLHPSWKQDKWLSNDLALLRLERDSCVRPVLLPEDGQKTPSAALFGGFGRSTEAGGFVSGLRIGNMTLTSHKQCNEEFELSQAAVKPMLCMRGMTSEAGGLCTGGEGGPLVVKFDVVNFDDVLFGIASFSDGDCTDSETPGIATSINNRKTLKWLRLTLFT